jgi:hypothetical protein
LRVVEARAAFLAHRRVPADDGAERDLAVAPASVALAREERLAVSRADAIADGPTRQGLRLRAVVVVVAPGSAAAAVVIAPPAAASAAAPFVVAVVFPPVAAAPATAVPVVRAAKPAAEIVPASAAFGPAAGRIALDDDAARGLLLLLLSLRVVDQRVEIHTLVSHGCRV